MESEIFTETGSGVDRAQVALQASAEAVLAHATIGSATHGQLTPSPANVRSQPGDLTELKASICAHGLLQNLVCYAEQRDGKPTGLWAVAAGNRRWHAIGQLIAEGQLPYDYRIPFLLITEAEAVVVSLAENLHAPMHPADLFDGMLTVARQGRSADEIGWMFGLSAKTVRQRLKLANVAPRLFALYRADKASYEQMAALAVSDDHQAQQAAWDSLEPWARHPQTLRRLLTAHCIAVATDPVARFVGVKAYEAAGGTVLRDLFSQAEDGYIEDAPLLESLARTRLDAAAKRLHKERWAWIDVMVRHDTETFHRYGWMRMIDTPPSPPQQAALRVLDERADALIAALAEHQANGAQEAIEQAAKALAAVDSERGKLRLALRQPDPAERAIAGVIVTIDEEGKLCVLRGAIRPQDRSKDSKHGTGGSQGNAGERGGKGGAVEGKQKVRPVHSERLTMLLTAQRTLALRAELVRQPDIAVLVLAQQLIRAVFYHGAHGSAMQLDLRVPPLPDEAQQGAAWDFLVEQRTALAAQLPPEADGAALLAWLRSQPRQRIDAYVAYCVATIVNGVQQRECVSPAIEALAQAVSLDMHAWWQPTAASYFSHVSKRRILDVVAQATAPEKAVPLETMRKDAAAEAAARTLADVRWLPAVLRGEVEADGSACMGADAHEHVDDDMEAEA